MQPIRSQTMDSFRFGATSISRANNANDIRAILDDPWLQTRPIIIKPIWVSQELADFTDARTLRMLFEALDTRIIVTESHMILRHGDGKSFTVNGTEVNWKWLQKGDGWNWLGQNPDWNWFRQDGHWDYIQEEEQRFLHENGFADLFDEFDVTYINVTDEVWNCRTADPDNVKNLVESRYNPVHMPAFYSIVPQKLFNLRGSTFISLAKLKMYASFTVKNLFGMIPDPCRPYWHGPAGSRIATSIIDINKIYQSLFNMYGICEGLSVTGIPDPDGGHEAVYSGRYSIVKAPGLIISGRDMVSLDAMLLELTKGVINNVPSINQDPIILAQEEFGPIDKIAIDKAKIQVGSWFSY